MSNAALSQASKAKKDEFYTQLTDIEKEAVHYREHFEGKTILCNCDDPYESDFFKFFAMNFNSLKLKKLIVTCYSGSPIAGEQLDLFSDFDNLPKRGKAYVATITEMKDFNGDGRIDLQDVQLLLKNGGCVSQLNGNGDFRSEECISLLKQSDVVVTNPPFSLFREYVAQLMEFKKDFLIIGNLNAVTYKEIFKYIMENKLWFGRSIHSGDREFRVPDDYPLNAATTRVDNEGKKYIRVKGVRWYTNMDVPERHETLLLYKTYYGHEADYPKYDNYDAIEVGKTEDIPGDYFETMGVPITMLDKYNPDQFSILGITKGREEFGIGPTKRYENPIQVNKDGTKTMGSKVDTGANLLHKNVPTDCTYYTADNADGYLTQTYPRLLVRRKK
jgi:hypothetical protein